MGSAPRVGTISYCTQSGLGILARDFIRHGLVQKILVCPHPHYQEYPEWYDHTPGVMYTIQQAKDFLEGLDCLLLFENAFNYWKVVQKAKGMGIRVVLAVNYEYTPFPCEVEPDLYLCPSLLDLKYYSHLNAMFLPVPVEREWKHRGVVNTFVHNAGHGGKNYRNGTPQLLEAMQHVKSDLKLIVRGQPDSNQIRTLFKEWQGKDPRVTFILDEVDDEEMYSQGEIFAFPERYNGLSLPLQEAFASGMVCMCGDRYPMNTWLPREPMVRVQGYTQERLAVTFDCAYINPRDIAAKMDEYFGRDVSELSRMGKVWAEEHSWDALREKYIKVLGGEK